MAVLTIDRRVGGSIVASASVASRGVLKGKYVCHAFGDNAHGIPFDTLDEVADFLRANPRTSVRMRPGWSRYSEDIYIDGIAR